MTEESWRRKEERAAQVCVAEMVVPMIFLARSLLRSFLVTNCAEWLGRRLRRPRLAGILTCLSRRHSVESAELRAEKPIFRVAKPELRKRNGTHSSVCSPLSVLSSQL